MLLKLIISTATLDPRALFILCKAFLRRDWQVCQAPDRDDGDGSEYALLGSKGFFTLVFKPMRMSCILPDHIETWRVQGATIIGDGMSASLVS